MTNSGGKTLAFGSGDYSSYIKYNSKAEFDIEIPKGVKITSIKITGSSNKSGYTTYLADLVVGSSTPNKSTTTYASQTFPDKDDKSSATYTYTLSTAADGDDATNNVIKFMFCAQQTVAKIYLIAESSSTSTYTLDFGDYEWKSLCLDFDATIPTGVEAYTGKLNDDETVVVTTKIINDNSTDKVLPAKTPVVVKKVGTATSYTLEQGTTTRTYSDYTGNELQGVTEQTDTTTLTKEGKTILTLGVDASGEYGFRLPSNTYIGANRAYLYVTSTSTSTARGVIGLSSDGDTSSIGAINAKTSTADAPTYNMMGQRVGANAKGLIIKGGRKYIVK